MDGIYEGLLAASCVAVMLCALPVDDYRRVIGAMGVGEVGVDIAVRYGRHCCCVLRAASDL